MGRWQVWGVGVAAAVTLCGFKTGIYSEPLDVKPPAAGTTWQMLTDTYDMRGSWVVRFWPVDGQMSTGLAFALDIGEKRLDQWHDLTASWATYFPSTAAGAGQQWVHAVTWNRQPVTVARSDRRFAYGNPREPDVKDLWCLLQKNPLPAGIVAQALHCDQPGAASAGSPERLMAAERAGAEFSAATPSAKPPAAEAATSVAAVAGVAVPVPAPKTDEATGVPGDFCGPGECLLFLVPGLFDTVEQHYVRQTAAFASSIGVDVMAMDARDHGDTRRMAPNSGVTFSFGLYESADVAQLLDHLVLKKPELKHIWLLGYSFGGTVVLRTMERIAAEVNMHPSSDRIAGALTIGAPLSGQVTVRRIHKRRPSQGDPGSIFAGLATIRLDDAKLPGAPSVYKPAFGRREVKRRISSLVDLAIQDPTVSREYLQHIALYGQAGPDLDKAVTVSAPPDWVVERTVLVYSNNDPVIKKQWKGKTGFREQFDADVLACGLNPENHFVVARRGGHLATVVSNQRLAREALTRFMIRSVVQPERCK